jgi:hypothetical protein
MHARNNSRPTAEEVCTGGDKEDLCEKDQEWQRDKEMGKKLTRGTKESPSRILGEILPCRSVPVICS